MKQKITISALFVFFIYKGLFAFLPDSSFIVHKIIIQGNKQTKNHIILRELTFIQNDTLSIQNWMVKKEESIKNLLNTSLFLTAVIDTSKTKDSVIVRVNVMERWNIFPIPIFDVEERNFNAWWNSDKWSRLSGGMFFAHRNFRGRMEMLRLMFQIGYNKTLGISYSFPYINKSKTLGLNLQCLYTLRHEVNHQTLGNKQDYLKLPDEAIQQNLSSYVQLTWRPNHHYYYLFSAGFEHYNFADSLLKVNPFYSNGKKRLDYFNFGFKAKNDHRDYKSYPLKGYYADLEVWQSGLGKLDNSNLNVLTLKFATRWYQPIINRFYFAAGVSGKVSNQDFQPFLIQKGLGYSRDFVRGFENYVVDGENYIVLKQNLKYNILKTKHIRLKFIKSPKFNNIPFTFYLNAFTDAGYCSNRNYTDATNTFSNQWLFGYGTGIDIVSYYDMILRLEYSLNQFNERGFYLHWIAPI